MLVLSRKVGQRIVLDGGVVVTVVGTRGSQVRLGVEAPPDVGILREEVVGTERRKHELSPRQRSRA